MATTVQAGSSGDFTIQAGRTGVFTTSGEGLVRTKTAVSGASFETRRVTVSAGELLMGPFDRDVVVTVFGIAGATTAKNRRRIPAVIEEVDGLQSIIDPSTGSPVSGDGNVLKGSRLGAQVEPKYAAFPGLSVSALSSTTGWTVTKTGTASGNVVPTTLSNGMPGLLMSVGAASDTVYITNTADFAINYAPDTLLGLWLEVPDAGREAFVTVLIGNETAGTFTNYRSINVGNSGGAVNSGGLYFIPFRCDAGSATGAPAASGVYKSVRIRLNAAYKNQGGSVKIAGFGYAPAARPRIALTFDDGFLSQYTDAFRILSKYGIPATLAVTSGLANANGYCTTAMHQAMYAAGWDLVCHGVQHYGFNGSTSSGNFGKTTLCAAQTPVGAGALTMNGTIGNAAFDAPRHVVVWSSSTQDYGVKVTLTGLAKDGVTPQSEDVYCQGGLGAVTKNLFMGPLTAAIDQATTGTISVGTSLSEAEMRAQITGSQAYLLGNGMPRGAYDWVYPSGEFNTTSTALLQALGFRSARIVGGQYTNPAAGDFRPFEMGGQGGALASGGSAAFLAYIDDIINRGLCGLPYLHNFSPTVTDSVTTLVSDLQLVADALAQRARDGKVELITQPQIPVS